MQYFQASIDDFVSGVMPHCLDPGTVKKVIFEVFKGSEWEKSMSESGDRLKSRSKPAE